MKSYMCQLCGLIYNEADGWPEDGIPAGTAWADVPDTWLCPECGAGKSDFEMMQIQNGFMTANNTIAIKNIVGTSFK